MLFENAAVTFLETLVIKGYSPATIRGYQHDLLKCQQFLQSQQSEPILLQNVTVDQLEQYMAYLLIELDLQPRSRNRYLSSVTSLFQYGLKKEWITRNPASFVDSAKVRHQPKKTLSEEEIIILLNELSNPVIRMAIELMAKTGLRCGEATNLQLEHLDLEQNELHVIDGKGGKYRNIPISESLNASLTNFLVHQRQSDSLYVLATEKTGRITPYYINKNLKLAIDRLEWKKHVTNHTLRHSFATNLYRRGVGLAAIKQLLGHDNLRTTSIYVNAQESELRTAVNLL